MAEQLTSKSGSNREGGRGASADAVVPKDGGHGAKNSGGASFFGSSDGSNKDTQNSPTDRGHTKSTL